ncbi:MAG: hypothetical protein U1D30_23345 [Planctomycetota bacterium]
MKFEVHEQIRGGCNALVAQLSAHEDQAICEQIVQAATAKWGTESSVRVGKEIRERDRTLSNDIIQAVSPVLARKRSPLAEWTTNPVIAFATPASAELIRLGPKAEPEVLRYLDHPSTSVRVQAYKILAEIGTGREPRPIGTSRGQNVRSIWSHGRESIAPGGPPSASRPRRRFLRRLIRSPSAQCRSMVIACPGNRGRRLRV